LEDFEVKLLVSLVPGVQAEYRRGEIVKLGDESEMPGLDRALYGAYHVLIETDAPSGLVGDYTVNKYTADVSLFLMDDLLQGTDLQAVQEVLRRTHCIDNDIIARYRRAPVYKE